MGKSLHSMPHLSRGRWKKQHSDSRVTHTCTHTTIKSAEPHYESFMAFYSGGEQSEAFTSSRKICAAVHVRAHARGLFSLLLSCSPRAPRRPGVSSPPKLLTGKGSVHQRAVVSKQAAAASPGIRGCVFDVTSRVEVATLAEASHCRGLQLDMRKRLRNTWNSESERVLVATVHVRKAECAHATGLECQILYNLKYTVFSFKTHTHAQCKPEHVCTQHSSDW